MPQNTHKWYEIRCPVYGFVKLSDWEREIISQPAFQRLRRIRQLAWTDYVYPGAMHTRFEHSLGVMHMATLLYDGVVERSFDILHSQFGYNEDGLKRHRTLIRLAALLHDIGHAPFSHAAEELLPFTANDPSKRYRHEHYSATIVRKRLADVIEHHPLNMNYGLKADDVATFLENGPSAGKALFWRDLIDGQMDADRMDYLLRDSHHAGVDYGRYDWRRLLHTIVAVPDEEGEGSPRLGVTEGGWHAAEALILARYFMFMQVYFHKTRVILDHHLQGALETMLPGGKFPPPEGKGLDEYLDWHDWRVLGLLESEGGKDGERLATRKHYREVAHTPEAPSEEDEDRLRRQREALEDLAPVEISSDKSWYRIGNPDIPVISEDGTSRVSPLSRHSSVVKNVEAVHQVRLYVDPEDRDKACQRLARIGE